MEDNQSLDPYKQTSLRYQLYREARAMAEYAPLWTNYERRLTQLAKLGSIDPQI